jgi:Protein of unknown function (DUF2946)
LERGVTTMPWFRSRLRFGGCLALLALALQLALTFGHVHLDAFAAREPAQAAGAHGQIASSVPDPASGETPALDDDYCAICALVQLAGSMVTPTAPPLLPPMQGEAERRTLVSDFYLSRAPPARFHARAPPLVA